MTDHLLTQTLPRDIAARARSLMQGPAAGLAEDRAVDALASAVMTPSPTLNATIASLAR